MREKENFREQLQRLMDRYPGREVIDIKEAADMLGVHPRTLRTDDSFPQRKIGGKTGPVVVPLVGLARWLS